jgi:hypothetical protein
MFATVRLSALFSSRKPTRLAKHDSFAVGEDRRREAEPMPSCFTAAQKADIMAQARKNAAPVASLAASRKPNGSQMKHVEKYIEQDVASSQEQIIALRADLAALQAQVEVLSRTVAALAEDVSGVRSFVRKGLPVVQLPQAVGEGMQWWEWVDDRIENRLSDVYKDTGTALGKMIERVRDELEQQTSAGKREHELLRRELTVLRDEVGVERELKDLRSQVAKAQRAVPKLPANRGSAPRGGHDGETVGRAIAKAEYARRTYEGPFLEGEAKPVRTVNLIASPLGRR